MRDKPVIATRREFEIPDQSVRSHAEQISDAVDLLYEDLGNRHCVVVAVQLLGAFAIEIFLKCLSSETISHEVPELLDPDARQLTSRPTKFGHDLRKQFDHLDDRIRNGLEAAYAAKPCIPGVPALRDAIDRYRNLFEEIRYIFEKKDFEGQSITHLVKLVQFLREQVSLMPTISHWE